MRVSNLLAGPTDYPEIEASGLPEKNLPILRAAVASGATYLVTGDRRHFGQEVAGVLVLLATRTEEPCDDASG
jgi:hypothetical protein